VELAAEEGSRVCSVRGAAHCWDDAGAAAALEYAKGEEAEVAPDEAVVAPRAEPFVASSSRSSHAWLRRRKASRCTRSGIRMNPEVDRVVPLGWDYSSIDLATRAVCLVEGTMCSPAVASGVVRQVG